MPVAGHEAFLAGLLSGSFSVLLGHPLDTLKVRSQITGAASVVRDQGRIRSLYRGVLPPLLTVGCIHSLTFGVYETSRQWLHQTFPKGGRNQAGGHPSYLHCSLAAGVAGSLITVIVTPVQLVKIQQQAARSSNASKGMLAVGSTISRRHGPWALWRGVGINYPIETFGRMAYFPTYEFLKNTLGRLDRSPGGGGPAKRADEKTWVRALAGFGAGTAGWMLIYPFDVLRSRFQAQPLSGGSPVWMSYRVCWERLHAERGYGGLYRGFGFVLMRAGPVSSILLPLYDFFYVRLTAADAFRSR